MDDTSVIMSIMKTLNKLQITRLNSFDEYLLMRMSVRWYVETSNKEASTLTT